VGEAHQPKTGAVLEGIAFGCTVRKSGGPSRPCGGAARYEPIRRRHDDPVAVSCTGLVGVSGLGRGVVDDRWCGLLKLRGRVDCSDGRLREWLLAPWMGSF
jgi:hypothetical protein